jgi:hypothetical protein
LRFTRVMFLFGWKFMKTTRDWCYCLAVFVAVSFGMAAPARAQSAAYAVNFNGVDQFLQVPSGVWFNGDFTVEGWVFVRNYNAWSRLLDFANGQDNGNVYLALSFGASGFPAMGVFTNTGTPVIVATNMLPLNQWVHLAVTASGTNGTIYINEVPAVSGVINVAPNVVRTNNYFGRSNYAADQYADAIFDEIRIWNYARPLADITKYRDSRLAGDEGGLVGYWRFDEGAGSLTTNSVGGNSGQLTNGANWVVSTIASASALPTVTAGPNSVILNGTVCPGGFATSVSFVWGADTGYGSSSDWIPVGSGMIYTNSSLVVTGLSAGTTYHFTVYATNALGTQMGLDRTFSTPGVFTTDANGFTTNAATLHGSALSGGLPMNAWFEWGLTTNYDHTTASQAVGGGSDATNFQQAIVGLMPGLTEHYRAVASNSFGIFYGGDATFIAPAFAAVINLPVSVSTFYFSGTSAAWGDFNNDGYLDLLYFGPVPMLPFGTSSRTYLFENTVTNGFQDVADAIAPGMSGTGYGYGIWFDFDGDGKLDLLLSGSATHIWRNTGNGFVNVTASVAPNLPVYPIAPGSGTLAMAAAWDYDNDGRQDLLIAGASSQLWHSTASGFSNVTALVTAGLSSFGSTWAAWGDYDGDGFSDFLIGGSSGLQLWRNTGNGFTSMTGMLASELTNAVATAAAWGDINNDGLPDIVLASVSLSNPAQLWLNTGNGFTNASALFPTNVTYGVPLLGSPISLGDFDNDGFLDILAGTGTFVSPISRGQIWRNTGTNFIDVTGAVAPALAAGGSIFGTTTTTALSWGDYDNDGRLDFFICQGLGSVAPTAEIWNSSIYRANTPPIAPSGLSVSISNQVFTFRWNSGSDSATPAAALTYSFGLGTSPGSYDIISPLADVNGTRQLPAIGNRQNNRTINIHSLNVGQPYYWGVQSVDSGYAGSSFATGTFKLGGLFLPPSGVLVPGDMNGDGVVSPGELAAALNNLSGPVSAEEVEQVLSNYLAQGPLYFTNTVGLGSSNVTFALTNSPTNLFSVEYSTNLTDWQWLGPGLLRYGFTDTNAVNGETRYYRLKLP